MSLAETVIKALEVKPGDLVVFEMNEPITAEAHRNMSQQVAALIAARPELKGVTWIFLEQGQLNVHRLSAEDRVALARSLLAEVDRG